MKICRIIIQISVLILINIIMQYSYALDLELTQGINAKLPIYIDNFGNDNIAQELKTIISNDLRVSGEFSILPITNADTVVTGQIQNIGVNKYQVKFKLIDKIGQNKALLTNAFQIHNEQTRALAHHISDLIYEKLLGRRGIFSTRIAYVLVQRQDDRTNYSLDVADVDGFNPQSVFTSTEPIMSPSWSPDGSKIAFVSFENRKAQIFIVDIITGKRQLITNFGGINGAPSWSIDGTQLALVLSKSGNPKIYTVNLSSGNLKQLTFGAAIDTEPRFSPNGKFMLFTSGRGGSPQIYRLSLQNGDIQRLTYDGNYNARATYTVDQKYIVMLHRENNNFNIAVQELKSGHVNVVTFSALDESPSIAPNGQLILYATKENNQGVLGIVSLDGRIHMKLPSRHGDIQEPAWSPFL